MALPIIRSASNGRYLDVQPQRYSVFGAIQKKETTAVKNNRPVNLELSTIRFPISAIVSILHRITGVGLFVAMGFVIWALSLSLESQSGFNQVASILNHPLAKFIAWGTLSFIFYHLVAGIKHLFMDAGYFETKETGALASQVTVAIAVIGVLMLGVWLW